MYYLTQLSSSVESGPGCAYPLRIHHHLLSFSSYCFMMSFTLLHHIYLPLRATGYVYRIHPYWMGLVVGSGWPMLLPPSNRSAIVLSSLSLSFPSALAFDKNSSSSLHTLLSITRRHPLHHLNHILYSLSSISPNLPYFAF